MLVSQGVKRSGTIPSSLCYFLLWFVPLAVTDAFIPSTVVQPKQQSYWTTQVAIDQIPPDVLSKIQQSPWRGGLEPAVDVPSALPCEVIQGSIPKDLSGTFFRNGPGRVRVGTSFYGHWFDGDGYVVKLTFQKSGQVTMQGRYVQTERYKKEGKGEHGMKQRGAFTDARNGLLYANLFQKPTNPANTSCRIVKNRDGTTSLLALAEGGPPHKLDPKTLETLGLYDYEAPREFGKPDSCASAHPMECPQTGEMYTCGLRLGVASAWPSLTELKAFKFVPGQNGCFKLDRTATIYMPKISFVHDMAISQHHLVFVIPPFQATSSDMMMSMLSTPSFGKRFRWNGACGTRIVVLKREDLSIVADVTTHEYLSGYHLVNAHDVDDGSVEIQIAAHVGSREGIERVFCHIYDEVCTDDQRCRLRSVTIDKNQGVRIRDTGPDNASTFELPSVHPGFIGMDHKHVFTNAAYPSSSQLVNCVERLDLETNQVDRASFGPHRFAMEPMVIPKKEGNLKDELNAYVLTLVYDSMLHATDCAILDAGNLGAGPIATVRLPTHVPFGFHGTWSDDIW